MMNDRANRRQLPAAAGLCTACRHARAVPSARGSVFVRCDLSATNPAFPRYPRLPVVTCDGYDSIPGARRSGSLDGE